MAVVPWVMLVLLVSSSRLGAQERPRPSRLEAEPAKPSRRSIFPWSRSEKSRPSPEDYAKIVTKGSSSKVARQEAIAALPMQRLQQETRRSVLDLVDKTGLFRQMPTIAVDVERDVYDYFSVHPDAAVSVWRALKISKFQMKQTGENTYESDAGDGTVGSVEVLLRTPTEQLVFCEGVYKSPLLLKPIRAKALLHLRAEFRDGASGRTQATHRVALFVSFPSQTVETAARVISPVSNIIVDRNFHEVSLFLHMMSLAMVRQPRWVDGVVEKMEGVPEARKTELRRVTSHVYTAGRRRSQSGVRAASATKPTKTPTRVGSRTNRRPASR
jgi:hypothetical protein